MSILTPHQYRNIVAYARRFARPCPLRAPRCDGQLYLRALEADTLGEVLSFRPETHYNFAHAELCIEMDLRCSTQSVLTAELRLMAALIRASADTWTGLDPVRGVA